MLLSDTRIPIGGVIRCCLGTIGNEYYESGTVEIGDKSKCIYCGTVFELKEKKEKDKFHHWEEVKG